MKRFLLALFAILLASGATCNAVDGYKDFKFGMTVPEVKKLAKIPLARQDQGNGLMMYLGEGFPFGTQRVQIAFFFLDGKLLRIGFEIPRESALGVLDSLREKYGVASSSSDPKTFAAVDTTPNVNVAIGFDHDTVIWRVSSDDAVRQSAFVIYTSPDYDFRLIEAQKKGIKDDL